MIVEAQSGSAYGNLVSETLSSGSHQLAQLLGDWPSVSRKGPLYPRLGLGIRSLILDARTPYGVRLPGERSLVAELYVSRLTVSSAYTVLRDDGVLVSRHGGGSWLNYLRGQSRQGPIKETQGRLPPSSFGSGRARPLTGWNWEYVIGVGTLTY
jgi:DNA-binding transcriptional regulator YhcF (GntR family)